MVFYEGLNQFIKKLKEKTLNALNPITHTIATEHLLCAGSLLCMKTLRPKFNKL